MVREVKIRRERKRWLREGTSGNQLRKKGGGGAANRRKGNKVTQDSRESGFVDKHLLADSP